MSLWLGDVLVAIVLVVTTEVMYRLGRRARNPESLRSEISTVQAAALGLLALLVGFTLSMADTRFDARRRVVLAEANAVGTTYLRADFLTEPERSESRRLLREYVEARRAYYDADADEVASVTVRAQTIHAELWTRAATVAREHPDWDLLGTYVDSLNEMIDLEASRELTMVTRVPPTVRILMILVAIVAVGITGFSAGLARVRHPLLLYLLPFVIAIAYSLIADLDRSRAGFISTGDLPMTRLQRSLSAKL